MSKIKKIPVEIISRQEKVFILMRRRRKLNELYPQRAILEEDRKNSSLIQANDWIDHDYYEKELAKSAERSKRMDEKYGMKLPKSTPPEPKPIIVRKIKPTAERI